MIEIIGAILLLLSAGLLVYVVIVMDRDMRDCPYPIAGDDGSVKDCIDKGHCACSETD